MQPLSEIEQQLQDSIRAVEAYTQENPHVFNTNKLSRRIRSDLRYIQQLLLEPEQEVTWARWQVRQLVYRWFGGWCFAPPRLLQLQACQQICAPPTCNHTKICVSQSALLALQPSLPAWLHC